MTFAFTVPSLLGLIAIVGGVLALIDGIIRVRGRGTAVLAVIEIIVAILFLLALFTTGIPIGVNTLGIILLIVLALQLVFRGSTRRSGVGITVVALILVAIWVIQIFTHIIPGLS